ncbi:Imm1 family immunity protein [Streptomyces sp. NPDC002773]|uniref:Imm1 family immunity protein n=1 Tax=Streptomyces sp. NPDC002773 TaxID=3154430 RepID=UPI00333245E3
MISAVNFNGEKRYLRDAEEVLDSLGEVLRPGVGDENHVKAVWLAFEREEDKAPVSFLDVSANLEVDLGGIVWFASDSEARRIEMETGSDMGNYFWVSESETVPQGEFPVFSDHYAPSYFDPRGVLSLADVRKAVEEFCQTGGSRPNGIRWVTGNQNGTWLD